jgi:hypothetical protein
MDLLANPGRLSLRSTQADINHSANLGQLEAPGLLLSNVGSLDFAVSGLFRNVMVPNGSDQLLLYAGTSATNVVRAGFHERDVYLIVENQGAGDVRPFLSNLNEFSPGDDVLLTFGRTGGLWQLSWQNLTNPITSGSSTPISLPWLDGEPELYVGVMASNAGTATSFVGQIDSFSVNVVPEPPSMALFGLGAVGVVVLSRRRRAKAVLV